MKMLSRIGLLMLVVALVLSAAPAGAQEETVAEDLAGFYVVYVSAGALEETDDGYLLTLEDVEEYLTLVASAPKVFAWREETAFMMDNWAMVPEVTATAMLETGGTTAWLMLSAAQYDKEAATLTFDAAVTDIYQESESADPIAGLESLEDVTLFIVTDAAFENALLEGLEMRKSRTPIIPRPKPPKI
ncbi:MAG: hypothetical protein JXB47_01500 [Anaerolineae bacterium]|nr:hypothetical protein [Anaerolineae bacterium]